MIEKIKSVLDVFTGILKIVLLIVVICFFVAVSRNIPKIIDSAEQISEKVTISVKNVKVEGVGVSDVNVEQVEVEDVHVGSHISLESKKREKEEKAKK